MKLDYFSKSRIPCYFEPARRKSWINFKLVTLVFRLLHNAGPQYLSSLLYVLPSRHLRLASPNLLSQPRINITLSSRGFWHASPSLWNNLPHHLRSIDSYNVFKSNVRTELFFGSSISGTEQFHRRASDSTQSRWLLRLIICYERWHTEVWEDEVTTTWQNGRNLLCA